MDFCRITENMIMNTITVFLVFVTLSCVSVEVTRNLYMGFTVTKYVFKF